MTLAARVTVIYMASDGNHRTANFFVHFGQTQKRKEVRNKMEIKINKSKSKSKMTAQQVDVHPDVSKANPYGKPPEASPMLACMNGASQQPTLERAR